MKNKDHPFPPVKTTGLLRFSVNLSLMSVEFGSHLSFFFQDFNFKAATEMKKGIGNQTNLLRHSMTPVILPF